mgnify:CR=1 FL=1
MAQTIADLMAETLRAAGVKRIYGVAGDSLNGFTDSLRRMKEIDWVHMRHEEAGAFAAGAEAHLTGELAVCAGSCGPGNMHLINGLFDCYRNRVPVLAIAAHIPSSEIGGHYFQETHPEQLFAECSHYVETISNPDQMPRVFDKAIRIAVAQRGVSVVVIPGDVALQMTSAKAAKWLAPKPAVVRPSDSELDSLAALLNDGQKVTLMCGAGCAGDGCGGNTLGVSDDSGVLGASGYTSKASAARMSPLRTSPGCSHWLENWCNTSRNASSPVTTTARAAASNWSRAQVTPIR